MPATNREAMEQTATAAGPRTPLQAELAGLTSVRFLAAFAVVAFHLGYALDLYGRLPGIGDLLLPGSSAVSFFFILSGFVLMWSCRTRPTLHFWRDRAARLLPLHVAIFVLGTAVGAAIGRTFQRTWGLELVLLQAWAPRSNAFSTHQSPSPASWTLSCEFFFYLVAPVAFAVLPRLSPTTRRVAIVVLGFTTLGIAVLSTAGAIHYVSMYQSPVMRLPEFVIGALLALEVHSARLPRVPLGAGCIAAGVGWLIVPHVPAPYGVASCTLLGWVLILVSIAQRDVMGWDSKLHHPAVQALGRSSFALYLVHGLVLTVAAEVLTRVFGLSLLTASPLWSMVFLMVFVPAVLGVATLMHRGVEQPLNRALRHQARSTA